VPRQCGRSASRHAIAPRTSTSDYTPHTFRHCFATHHLEQGTNLLLIQRLMGHANLQNTLKYLHVQNLSFDKLINPLDQLAGVQEL
jgi:site-specific recombinase XerD